MGCLRSLRPSPCAPIKQSGRRLRRGPSQALGLTRSPALELGPLHSNSIGWGDRMRHFGPLIIALSVVGCATIPQVEVPPPSKSQGQAVVLDIDGTLTPKNMAVHEPRPGAAEAVRALSAKGYKIIYLTTRIPLYQSGLPDWLRQNGFPEGILHVAQSGEERDQAGKFKARVLAAYLQRGWRLAYAYGDSSTDFTAYAEAGIPRERVFGLRRKGSKDCQIGVYQTCLAGWTEHLPYIESEIASEK